MRLIAVASLLVAAQAFASDGPQNTGTLSLELLPENILEGHFQIDRRVVAEVLQGANNITVEALTEFFQLSSDGSPCQAGGSGLVASDLVVTAVYRFQCANDPSRVVVSLGGIDRLPKDFSLGVKAASGHHSLDRNLPQTEIIASRSYFYFLAGLGFLTGSPPTEAALQNRQAALWFGGLQHLPPGFGLLLLIGAVWLLPFTALTRIFLVIGVVFLSGFVADFVLCRKLTQSVHSFLFMSHIYFSIVMSVFLVGFGKNGKRTRAIGSALIVAAAIAYGAELAIVLWSLEQYPVVEISQSVRGFSFGVTGAAAGALCVLMLLRFTLRRVGLTQGNPARLKFDVAARGVGALISAYAVLAILFRVSAW